MPLLARLMQAVGASEHDPEIHSQLAQHMAAVTRSKRGFDSLRRGHVETGRAFAAIRGGALRALAAALPLATAGNGAAIILIIWNLVGLLPRLL
jgi:hypothetical protein